MFDSNLWSEIASTIRKNKLRTFLTGFSVAWGIFILVVLLGAGNGLSNGIMENFEGDANNAIWMHNGNTSKAWKGTKPGRNITFDNDDLVYLRNNFDNVALVSGRFWLPWSSTSISYKNEFSSYSVTAIDPDYGELEQAVIQKGRFINDIDIKKGRKVAVLGDLVVQKLFKDVNPIGEYVKINGSMFKVVGAYKDQNNWDNKKVYIPRTTAQKIFNGGNTVHDMVVGTGDASPMEAKQLEHDILHYLSRKHVFDPQDKKAIRMHNRLDNYVSTLKIFQGITIFVAIIGIGTIIAGIVGVSNIMLITVRDRTKEIGIRKALGATPASVIFMIILEAILITSIFGYIGMFLGTALMEGINVLIEQQLSMRPPESNDPVMFRNPTINLSVAIGSTLLLVLAGTLAGFFPAWKAAKIRPVVALRDE